MSQSCKIVLTAGGTGGHLWPALSLALAIRRLRPEAELIFIGAGRPLEEKIIDHHGFQRLVLKTSGLKGASLGAKFKALGQSLVAVAEAKSILARFRPRLCFGAGGYVTVPVGLAARLSGIPLVIHEQNCRPGLSNKVLGKLARKVLLAFADSASSFAASKSLVCGNPIRPEIAALWSEPRDFCGRCLTVGITGGSQGARAVNRAAVNSLTELKSRGFVFQVIHQTGSTDESWVRRSYQEAGLQAETVGFISDMADFYRRVDLVLARAGAITVSELAAVKLPSILVPLPTAADDHQTFNAHRLADRGAALVIAQKDLAEKLTEALAGLLNSRETMTAMSEAAAGAAVLDSADLMAAACLDIIEGN